MKNDEFVAALNGNLDKVKADFSEGASGSFMYFTADKRFIVKTITDSEHKFLMSLHDAYFLHMSGNFYINK